MHYALESIKELALEAGNIVVDGYHNKETKQISHKGLVDLVTEFDIKTENFLFKALEKQFPNYQLIGEESFDKALEVEHKKVIYIDPIDGTTNFVHGIPHLAISIGIWEDGKPKHGVVYNPILGEFFYASVGSGAFFNGYPIEVSKQDTLQQSLIGTGFPYAKVNKGLEHDWVLETLSNLLANIRDVRRFGAAALDLCYLAQGKIDAFYEIDLQPWDVAGAIPILLEAGGKLSQADGSEYAIDAKSIVASNGLVQEALLSHLPPIG